MLTTTAEMQKVFHDADLLKVACEVIQEAAMEGDVEFLAEMQREPLLDTMVTLLGSMRAARAAAEVKA